MLSELLYIAELIMSKTIEGLRNKVTKWQEAVDW